MKNTTYYKHSFESFLRNKPNAEDYAILRIRDNADVDFPCSDEDTTLINSLKEENLFRRYGTVIENLTKFLLRLFCY